MKTIFNKEHIIFHNSSTQRQLFPTNGVMETVEGLSSCCSHFLLRVTERAADSGKEGVHVEEDVVT